MSQAEQSSGLVCRHFFCVNYQSRKVLANDFNDRLSIQHWFCTQSTGVQNESQVKMVSTSSTSLILLFFLNTNYLG